MMAFEPVVHTDEPAGGVFGEGPEPAEPPPMQEAGGAGDTLDASVLFRTEAEEIATEGVATAAEAFDAATGSKPLLEQLAGWVTGLWDRYVDVAAGKLNEAAAAFREARANLGSTAVGGNEESANDGLRSRTQQILARKAAALVSARDRLARAKADLRTLTIGIVGNPDRVIARPDALVEMCVTAAAVVGVLALEFFVNFNVIQFATDSRTSAAFSIIMSLVAALAAHIAAETRRFKAAYRDALAECRDCFSATRGRDPVTGVVARVFPLGAGTRFRNILSHSLFFAACFAVLAIRTVVIAFERGSWGDLAGSVGFCVVVAGYYLFKVSRPGVVHPRLGEYFAKEEEVSALTASVEQLENPSSEGEHLDAIEAAFGHYNETFARDARTRTAKVAKATEAKDRLRRLWSEHQESIGWFDGLYMKAAEALFAAVGTEFTADRRAEAEQALREADKAALALGESVIAEAEAWQPPQDASGGKITNNLHELVQALWKKAIDEQQHLAAEANRRAAVARMSSFRPGAGSTLVRTGRS